MTLAVVIAKGEIPRWRLEQGLLSLFFFPSSRGVSATWRSRWGGIEIATPSARNDIKREACNDIKKEALNDIGDITQCYTTKVSPIYLNEFIGVH